jgi:hypothetical protein
MAAAIQRAMERSVKSERVGRWKGMSAGARIEDEKTPYGNAPHDASPAWDQCGLGDSLAIVSACAGYSATSRAPSASSKSPNSNPGATVQPTRV